MSWSYSGDPSNSTRDAVRFLIGDTDTNDQQLSNEELDYLLTTYSSDKYAAAIAAVRALIAKFARLADKAVGDLRISYSQRLKHYQQLISNLQLQAATVGGLAEPYAGGISVSDKDSVEEDTDREPPAFTKDLHDYASEVQTEQDEAT